MAEKKTKTTTTKTKAKPAARSKAKEAAATAKVSSKGDEFRTKTVDELGEQLGKLKKEQLNLRFQRANGQLEKTNRIRVVRKDIARIQTILTEQRRTAG